MVVLMSRFSNGGLVNFRRSGFNSGTFMQKISRTGKHKTDLACELLICWHYSLTCCVKCRVQIKTFCCISKLAALLSVSAHQVVML